MQVKAFHLFIDQSSLTPSIQHLAKMLSTDRYQALALEVWERLPKAPEPAREQQHQLELA